MRNLHSLACFPIVWLLVSCGEQGSSNAPRNVDEHNAVTSALRTIVTAQKIFRNISGQGNFGSLKELVEAGLLDSTFLDFNRDSYRIALGVSESGFILRAEPEQPASDRIYYFCDQTGVIRSKTGSRADASSPPRSPSNGNG